LHFSSDLSFAYYFSEIKKCTCDKKSELASNTFGMNAFSSLGTETDFGMEYTNTDWNKIYYLISALEIRMSI